MRIKSIEEKGDVIIVREEAKGEVSIRCSAKPPYLYLGQTMINAARKASQELVVTKRFADGFPREIKSTSTYLGTPAVWVTSNRHREATWTGR
ncbi:MAG: hypothetical protein C4320_05020 [Armatimonadota bacterium]